MQKKEEKNEAQIQSIYVTMEKCNYAFPVNQSILGNGLRKRTKECKKRRHFLMFQSILSHSLKIVENSPYWEKKVWKEKQYLTG